MRRVRLEPFEHLVSVQIGHHDVQQDQVGVDLRDLFQRFEPARSGDDLVLRTAQHGFQQHDVRGDVVDSQNGVVFGLYGDVFHGGSGVCEEQI